jgi:hypothetical protein
METRPYLLLDVDGPLNPYRAPTPPPGYRRHELREGEKTWSLLLNPEHAVELIALAETFDLVWASSWEHGANRLIAPALGIPTDLPVISWPAGARELPCPVPRPPSSNSPREQAAPRRAACGVSRGARGVSWKTRHVADWVGERPFVWVDDEVGDADRAYLADRPRLGAHLLRVVEADRGLVPADFAAIRMWSEANC